MFNMFFLFYYYYFFVVVFNFGDLSSGNGHQWMPNHLSSVAGAVPHVTCLVNSNTFLGAELPCWSEECVIVNYLGLSKVGTYASVLSEKGKSKLLI